MSRPSAPKDGEVLPPEVKASLTFAVSALTPEGLEALPPEQRNILIRTMFGAISGLPASAIEGAINDRVFVDKLRKREAEKAEADSEYTQQDPEKLAARAAASAVKAADVAATAVSRSKGEERNSDLLKNGFTRLRVYLKAGDYGNFLYHFAEQTMRCMRYNKVPQKVYEGVKKLCVFCKAAGIAILTGLEISSKYISSVLGSEAKSVQRLGNPLAADAARVVAGVALGVDGKAGPHVATATDKALGSFEARAAGVAGHATGRH